jgi:hypothetical protein
LATTRLLRNLEEEKVEDADEGDCGDEGCADGQDEEGADEGDELNPGNWPPTAFKKRYKGRGANKEYLHTAMPGGVQVVPHCTTTSRRTKDGWDFNYSGVDFEDRYQGRPGASKDSLIPDERRGKIKPEFYRGNSLTAFSAKLHDPLFWLLSVLPLDSFWNEVLQLSNGYAFGDMQFGGAKGKQFLALKFEEPLKFYGAHLHDGVIGHSSGGIWQRWDTKSCTFSQQIAGALPWARYEQIKRVLHLCKNSDDRCNSRHIAYDPAVKVALFPDTIVAQCNAISTPDRDQTIDETTWGTAARGPTKSDLTKRIRGKPGVTKGGQHVVLSDATHKRPRAIIPRHKKTAKVLLGSAAEGPNEVLLLLQQLEDNNVLIPQLHLTADNYFSNVKLSEQMPSRVSATMTLNRSNHPRGLAGHLYKEKVVPHLEEVRAARHVNPSVAIKGDNAVVSMMSTGSTNFIIRTQGYAKIAYYPRQKTMGRAAAKRIWDIEMNEVRALYLFKYGIIDRIDRGIRDTQMSTICCRWYVPAMLHFFGMAVVVARDFYEEAYHYFQESERQRIASEAAATTAAAAAAADGGKGRGRGQRASNTRGGKQGRRGKGRGRGGRGGGACRHYPKKLKGKQFREQLSVGMLDFKLHDARAGARKYLYPHEQVLNRYAANYD